jgi:glycosyltransferase involved in cell wall biosynthesis
LSESNVLVSIVIPTLNSSKTIERCLNSINQQTYKPIEIVLVDKSSKDDTAEKAKKNGATVFVIGAKERCDQMNYGAKVAHGKYVYIVGSDFVLDKEVVEQAVKEAETRNLDAVCVHNTSDPSVSFWAQVRMLERDCYQGDELNVSARFILRDKFLAIGGYDETLVACEDYDIQNRMIRGGFKIACIQAKEMHIGEPVTLGEIARKHYYYGKTLPSFVEKNKDMATKQLSPFRPAFFRNIGQFLKSPRLTIGFLIYQMTRYGTAGMGYIVGKVKGSPIKN